MDVNEKDVRTIMGRKCQHSHPRDKCRNMRDDKSFEYYYRCTSCKEIMWDECNEKPEGIGYG